MCTGYHYTTKKNYKKIKRKGLVPYQLEKGKIRTTHGSYEGKVIWLWEQELQGISELGTILFHLATKRDTNIVKLRVEYNDKFILSPSDIDKGISDEDTDLLISHNGLIGDWIYHLEEPAVLVTKYIPCERISLIQEFDLLNIVNNKERKRKDEERTSFCAPFRKAWNTLSKNYMEYTQSHSR